MTNANTSHPTHRIYAVTKNGKNKIWKAIGAPWAHQDGRTSLRETFGSRVQSPTARLPGSCLLRPWKRPFHIASLCELPL